MQDLVAGQIDMMIDEACEFPAAGPRGYNQGLCGHGEDPAGSSARYPDRGRSGAAGFLLSRVWHALWAPKGTPKDIIAKLNAAVVDALADAGVRAAARRSRRRRFFAREQQTPEALGAHHKAEIDKWWPIIKAANIKAE